MRVNRGSLLAICACLLAVSAVTAGARPAVQNQDATLSVAPAPPEPPTPGERLSATIATYDARVSGSVQAGVLDAKLSAAPTNDSRARRLAAFSTNLSEHLAELRRHRRAAVAANEAGEIDDRTFRYRMAVITSRARAVRALASTGSRRAHALPSGSLEAAMLNTSRFDRTAEESEEIAANGSEYVDGSDGTAPTETPSGPNGSDGESVDDRPDDFIVGDRDGGPSPWRAGWVGGPWSGDGVWSRDGTWNESGAWNGSATWNRTGPAGSGDPADGYWGPGSADGTDYHDGWNAGPSSDDRENRSVRDPWSAGDRSWPRGANGSGGPGFAPGDGDAPNDTWDGTWGRDGTSPDGFPYGNGSADGTGGAPAWGPDRNASAGDAGDGPGWGGGDAGFGGWTAPSDEGSSGSDGGTATPANGSDGGENATSGGGGTDATEDPAVGGDGGFDGEWGDGDADADGGGGSAGDGDDGFGGGWDDDGSATDGDGGFGGGWDDGAGSASGDGRDGAATEDETGEWGDGGGFGGGW